MLPIAIVGSLYDDGDEQLEGSDNVSANYMPASRVDDNTKGHPCGAGLWPGVPIITGSGTVFINYKPVARVSDIHDTHCCGPVCHTAEIVTGEPTVLVGG